MNFIHVLPGSLLLIRALDGLPSHRRLGRGIVILKFIHSIRISQHRLPLVRVLQQYRLRVLDLFLTGVVMTLLMDAAILSLA